MACPIHCHWNNTLKESTMRRIFNQHKPISISTITRICLEYYSCTFIENKTVGR